MSINIWQPTMVDGVEVLLRLRGMIRWWGHDGHDTSPILADPDDLPRSQG